MINRHIHADEKIPLKNTEFVKYEVPLPPYKITHTFFLFLEILRFDLVMAILRLFGSFFAIYPLLILKESVDRTKWHRDLKFGIWDLYMIINWSLKYHINILKITPGFVAKTKKIEKSQHGQHNMWLHKISAFSQQKP